MSNDVSPEALAAALAKLPELQAAALTQVLKEGDEFYAKIKAALADPLIASSPAARSLRNAETHYLQFTRDGLREALAAYGVVIDPVDILPGGVLAIRPPALTKLEYVQRLLPGEVIALQLAEATDPEVAYFLFMFGIAENIRLEDPRTIYGAEQFERKGYFGPGRADEILGRPVGTFVPAD